MMKIYEEFLRNPEAIRLVICCIHIIPPAKTILKNAAGCNVQGQAILAALKFQKPY